MAALFNSAHVTGLAYQINIETEEITLPSFVRYGPARYYNECVLSKIRQQPPGCMIIITRAKNPLKTVLGICDQAIYIFSQTNNLKHTFFAKSLQTIILALFLSGFFEKSTSGHHAHDQHRPPYLIPW